MRVQGQRVGAGPSAIRAEHVRARARTEGVRVRARAVRRAVVRAEGAWAGGQVRTERPSAHNR